MKQLQGIGIFPKTILGPVYVFEAGLGVVPAEKITDTVAEIARFEAARLKAKSQLKDLYQKALTQTDKENAAIFDIHQLMLDDGDYLESVHHLIRHEKDNAAQAVAKTGDRFSHMFANMDDDYMKARAADCQDISQRIIRILCGKAEQYVLQKPAIIVAEDLLPSQLVLFDQTQVLGFATAKGTTTSHTAILARTRGVAAAVGFGDDLLKYAKNGQMVVLDAERGTLTLSPTPETLQHARRRIQQQQQFSAMLVDTLKGTPDQTQDGRSVLLYANVGNQQDLQDALQADARGVGLFRTEFTYLESAGYPTEEELFTNYRRAVEQMQGKKIIFRTLDIGADKTAPYFALPTEENPALGLRAIRLCLQRTDLFKTQLRALLRASAYGDVAIMFPMISSVREVQQAQALLQETKEELHQAQIPFGQHIQTGIMVETPAAALISDELASHVDFFSLGTNDLLQYTCALDRQNPNLIPFTDFHHPALLKLIELTVKNAHAAGKWVGICGELAADTSLTEIFLRMGIDELSVAPAHVLRVRHAIQHICLKQ